MEALIRVSRISYGIMMAALAVQQIVYAAFRPVILPPVTFPGITICVYITSIALFAASVAIILDKNARTLSLIFWGIFLILFVCCFIPYEFISDPNWKSLGAWTFADKDLVFAGGGFVVAGSYPILQAEISKESPVNKFLERLIPLGSVFFCITMISFGIDHFLYAKGVSGLVPAWIPGPMFWTYFAGAALALSGITIILGIQVKWSALLLSLMIFLWVPILHIPRAIADPYGLQGNEVSSVFEAFGFSGIAYLIACGYHSRKIV